MKTEDIGKLVALKLYFAGNRPWVLRVEDDEFPVIE